MKKFDKTINKKRVRNNNYSYQYSHSYARDNYSKKRPDNLRELILQFLIEKFNSTIDYYGQRITSAEQIAVKLEVLHKYVFQEFHKLQKEGLINICRDDNSFGKKPRTVFNPKTEYFKMPIMWDNYHSRWDSRVPKWWSITQKFQTIYTS